MIYVLSKSQHLLLSEPSINSQAYPVIPQEHAGPFMSLGVEHMGAIHGMHLETSIIGLYSASTLDPRCATSVPCHTQHVPGFHYLKHQVCFSL